jgi:hypothetical protein
VSVGVLNYPAIGVVVAQLVAAPRGRVRGTFEATTFGLPDRGAGGEGSSLRNMESASTPGGICYSLVSWSKLGEGMGCVEVHETWRGRGKKATTTN